MSKYRIKKKLHNYHNYLHITATKVGMRQLNKQVLEVYVTSCQGMNTTHSSETNFPTHYIHICCEYMLTKTQLAEMYGGALMPSCLNRGALCKLDHTSKL